MEDAFGAAEEAVNPDIARQDLAHGESGGARVTDELDLDELADILAEVDDNLAPPEIDTLPAEDLVDSTMPLVRSDSDKIQLIENEPKKLSGKWRKGEQLPWPRPTRFTESRRRYSRRGPSPLIVLAVHDSQRWWRPSRPGQLCGRSHVNPPYASRVSAVGDRCQAGLGRHQDPDYPCSGALRRPRSTSRWQADNIQTGLLDRHNDDRHSASKRDSTFPHSVDGIVNWGDVGCSPEHDAAHLDYWTAFLKWRVENVFGESTFSGYSIVRPTWLAVLPTLDAEVRELPRTYPVAEKYADLVTAEVHGSATLLASGKLDSAASCPPGDDDRDFETAASTFTYYASCINHLSAPYYASPDRSLPQLGRVQQIEGSYAEVRLLLGIEVDPKDAACLSRAYIARCNGVAGFYVPPAVKWAMDRDTDDFRASEMDEAQIIASGSVGIAQSLLAYVAVWRVSGRESIGRSICPEGIIPEGIAGWKVHLQEAIKTQSYPVPAAEGTSCILTPTLSCELAAPTESPIQRASDRRVEQLYPLEIRASISTVATPAISATLALPTCTPQQRMASATAISSYSLEAEGSMSPIATPACSLELGIPLQSARDIALASGLVQLYPLSPRDSASEISTPAIASFLGLPTRVPITRGSDFLQDHLYAVIAGESESVICTPAIAKALSASTVTGFQRRTQNAHAIKEMTLYPVKADGILSVVCTPAVSSSLAAPTYSAQEEGGRKASKPTLPIQSSALQSVIGTPAIGTALAVPLCSAYQSYAAESRVPIKHSKSTSVISTPALSAVMAASSELQTERAYAAKLSTRYPLQNAATRSVIVTASVGTQVSTPPAAKSHVQLTANATPGVPSIDLLLRGQQAEIDAVGYKAWRSWGIKQFGIPRGEGDSRKRLLVYLKRMAANPDGKPAMAKATPVATNRPAASLDLLRTGTDIECERISRDDWVKFAKEQGWAVKRRKTPKADYIRSLRRIAQGSVPLRTNGPQLDPSLEILLDGTDDERSRVKTSAWIQWARGMKWSIPHSKKKRADLIPLLQSLARHAASREPGK